MTPIDFRASVVVADNGNVLIVLFDGAHAPSTLAVLRCSRESAAALAENISSALGSGETED